jgi:hypothetical protein
MTKEEIDKQINEFMEILVYEAQLISFQKKILHKIKDTGLRKHAESRIRIIQSSLKNGKYFQKSSKPIDQTVIKKKNPVSVTKNKKNKPTKKHTGNKNDIQDKNNSDQKKEILFDYKKYTYQELSNLTAFTLDFINRIIHSKGINEPVIPDEHISDNVWSVIKEAVFNKLRLNEASERKEKSINIIKSKKSFTQTPLRTFVGGNFGKLIFTGKTS